MAKIVGLVGSVKGKIGNTVMAVRRGVQIARVYQPNVNNPKSARQEYSRAKMAFAVRTLKPFLPGLRAGWNLTNPTYEFQQAVSKAIPVGNEVIKESAGTLIVDEAELGKCLAANLMPQASYSELSFETADTVSLAVLPSASSYMDNGGNAVKVGCVVMVWNPDLNDCVVSMQEVTDGPATRTVLNIKVPEHWSGMTVQVYAFCKQIPTAVNGIDTEILPWRFPSKTTEGFYVGSGTLV